MRSTPSSWAALGPSTTTRSARAPWPWSGSRPLRSLARMAVNSPGEAASTASLNSVLRCGSLIGVALTSASPTSTSLMVPAATTPLSRPSRCAASQGRSLSGRPRRPAWR